MRSELHFVCQHLEMVSRKTMGGFLDVLKGRRGIYVLYSKKRVRHVGSSKNLRRRLTEHFRDRYPTNWDQFSVYLTIESDYTKEFEALTIRITATKAKRHEEKLTRSQDLRKAVQKNLLKSHKKRVHLN